MPKPSTSPLDGIRVLDLGRVVAAPYAAQLLGDLGADVIKVERPKVGDDVRAYANQGHFLAWNRNKRSITIDLSHADGQALVKRLAEKADVLIENYIPGTMKRFGLDYESLSADNPRLIYCSVSGYGQEGPFAQRGGMDHIFQARGGLMSVLSPEPVRTGKHRAELEELLLPLAKRWNKAALGRGIGGCRRARWRREQRQRSLR